MKNKRAAEKIFSTWWFVMVVVIVGAVIILVSTFYSKNIDVRPLEADILYEKLMDCVTDQGFVTSEFSQPNFDVFKFCNLNKKLFQKEEIVYFNISFFDKDNNLIKTISSAATQFDKDCRAVSLTGIEAKKHANCVLDKENVLYPSGVLKKIESGKIEILTASNIVGRKIRK